MNESWILASPRPLDTSDTFIKRHWCASLIDWSKGQPLVGRELNYPLFIVEIEQVMTEIVRNDDPLFSIDHSRSPAPDLVSFGDLGQRLVWCLNTNFEEVTVFFEKYELSPYFQLLRRAVLQGSMQSKYPAPETVGYFNAWVQHLRAEARSAKIATAIQNHNRTARANTEGISRVIRRLRRKKSTLLVIRMVLGCRWNVGTLGDFHRPAIDAQREFGGLLRSLKRKFKSLAWHSWRLEHGPNTSFYHQLMLVFHGKDTRDEITPGVIIEKMWLKQVKRGNGFAVNCNNAKSIYKWHGMTGLGILLHNDLSGYGELEDAAIYLAKMGAYAKLDVGIRKTYSSGQVKLQKPRKRSSPRTVGTRPPPIRKIRKSVTT